jgi:hypothetical protein
MSSYPNEDRWKDDLLAKAEILQVEFANLPDEQKLWLIEHKDIFYNYNGNTILNLSHIKYKGMAKLLKVTAKNRHNGTYWNTTDLPKIK